MLFDYLWIVFSWGRKQEPTSWRLKKKRKCLYSPEKKIAFFKRREKFKIIIFQCFTERQKHQAFGWKKILRKVAVERNLLHGGSGCVHVGYAGFKRLSQHRVPSYPSTRSSTTSPPESACAISPPPMPQSNSAPPHMTELSRRLMQHEFEVSFV